MNENKINILGVDDKPENLFALAALMEDLNVNLVKAGSGSEALECLLKEEFALILMDVMMPEMDGFETARRIRKRRKTQQVPIIFITAYTSSQEQIFEGYDSGAVDYLGKPLVPEILRSKIKVFLKLYEQNKKLEEKASRLELANQQIKEQQKALADVEVNFRTAFEQSFQFMAILDGEGRILELNHLAQKLCGNFSGSLKGYYLWNVCWVGQDDENKRLENVIKRAARGERITDEARFTDIDGKTRFLSRAISPVRDSGGNISFITVQGHDITRKVYAEKERQNLSILLQQAQKMEALGVLASGVAHDFNNILSVMLGNAELARMSTPEDSPAQQYLESIRAAGTQAKDLVKQILSFSRQGEMQKSKMLPVQVIRESLKLLRSTMPSHIKIVEKIDERCGSVYGDPTQYHQVVMNLCTNACHAMEKTGGVLTVALRQEVLDSPELLHKFQGEPGEYAHLMVADSGQGIDGKHIDRIYEPYFTTKKSDKGTGMGLSIVYGIIQEHGGAIYLETEKGAGTTFHVFFPIGGAKSREKKKKGGSQIHGSEHILLVDDDEKLLEMSQKILEQFGYTVTVRKNGTEAYSCFADSAESFDLVIADQAMPGLTGTQLAEKIFTIKPEVPFILCTGYGPGVSREKVKAMGIKELVFKPLAFDELSRLIRRTIDQTG